MMKNEGVPVESVYQFNIYNVSTRTNYWGSWFDQIQQFETGNNTVSFAAGMTLGTAPSAQYYTDWFTQYTYFSGDIAEILVYNQPLTSAQRQAVSGYLNGFYGLVPSTPATPSNLLAHAISPTQISLTWDEALNAGATQIGIERSTASNGTFQVVAQIPGATSYLDTTNLNPATTYYYRVRAINTTNWSSYSSIAFATTPTVGTNLPLPALALWLKADAGVLQGSSNMPVNVWADQSGNANDAIAVVSPAWVPNAIGDRPVIHFDGGSTFFNLPYFMNGATGAEAFVVLKTETNQPGSSSSLWEMGGDNWNGKGYPNGNNVIQDDFGSGGGYGNGGVHQFATVQPLNQYHIYEVSSQTNDWDAWINGVWQAHVSQNSVSFAATPSLGASVYEQFWVDWVQQTAYFSGDIAEVLVFNRGLTPDERTTVNVYLNGKYGLVPAIPATPSNLVATAVSPMQVALTWNESLNGGATRVSIERLYAGGWAYQEIARVSDTTSYVDTNAPPGTICYYRVRAINTDQWSPYSAPAEATTPVSGNGLPFNALALWLRSDAGFWLNSTSQPVSFWADQSGAQNHATQSFPAAEPVWFSATNGLPAVMQFNGTNSSFNLPYFLNGMAGTEAFVVLETTVTNQVHSLWDFGGYNWLTQKTYPNTDGSISDDFASTTVQYLGVPPQPINQFHVYEVSSQQDNWQAWFNGTSLYQTPETGFNTLGFAAGMYLGTSQYAVDDPGAPFIYYRNSFFAGNIAEVLVFNRSLTTGERTGVNNYLAGKYGLRPVVSIVSPINNTVVPGVTNITITAAASDTAGISQVQFFTGAVSLGIVTNSPYGLTWSNVAFGSYALTAQALDNNGLTFTSAVVNVTVAGIALTAPQTNSVFAAPANLPLSATVVDGAGVSQVQFFAGATVIATLTNAPYSLIWSNVPSGLYALTAAATDDYGMTLTSSVVNVTVDSLPSVTLTNPANSARFIAGTNINLAASASDVFGTVTQVQYFQGTNLLGAATNSPYSVVWSNAPFGAFALTAQATDNYGLTATSSVVNIMVAGIAITNPVNNVVLTAPASVSIGAAVTDNMGITQVQFFQGTTSLGTVTSPPYTINWTSVAAGVYSVTATGTDSGGFVFTSAPVNVIVDTNPNTSDRDGDGVSDWIEYLEGRNPLVAGAVPDTNGIVNLQTYTPLQ
jgi:hypothetical protein